MLNDFLEKILIHGMVAFGGGATRYLSFNEQPKLIKFFIGGIIGSFTGVIFFLFASCISQNQYWTAAMAGLGGWTGNEGMTFLFNAVKKFTSKKIDKINDIQDLK